MATPSSNQVRSQYSGHYSIISSTLSHSSSTKMTISEANNHDLKDKTYDEVIAFFSNINLNSEGCLTCLNTIDFSSWEIEEAVEFLKGFVEERFFPTPLVSLNTINLSNSNPQWIIETFAVVIESLLPIPFHGLNSIDFSDWTEQQVIEFLTSIKKHFLPLRLPCLRTINFTVWKSAQSSLFFEMYQDYLPDFFSDNGTIREVMKGLAQIIVPKHKDKKEFLVDFYDRFSHSNKARYFDIMGPYLSYIQIANLNFDALTGKEIEKILRNLTEEQAGFLNVKTVVKNLFKLPPFSIRLTQAIRDKIPTDSYTKKQLMELGAVLFPWDNIKQISPKFFNNEFYLKFFDAFSFVECFPFAEVLSEAQIKKININKIEEVSEEEIDRLIKEIDEIMGDSSSTITSCSSSSPTLSSSSTFSTSNTSSMSSSNSSPLQNRFKLARYLKEIPESDINHLKLEYLASIDFDLLDDVTINKFLTHLSLPLLLCVNIPNLLKNAKKISGFLILKIMSYFRSVKVNFKLDVADCTVDHFTFLNAEHFTIQSLKQLNLRHFGVYDDNIIIMRFFNNNPLHYLSRWQAFLLGLD